MKRAAIFLRSWRRALSLALAALPGVFLLSTGCRHSGQNTPDGVTKAPPPRFVDVAQAAGLNYAWTIPGKRPLNILQTIGNGCAFLDYDNDGNLESSWSASSWRSIKAMATATLPT